MTEHQIKENPAFYVASITIGTADELVFSGPVGFEDGEFKLFCDKFEEVLQGKFEYAEIEFDNHAHSVSFCFDEDVSIGINFELQGLIQEIIDACYMQALESYSNK